MAKYIINIPLFIFLFFWCFSYIYKSNIMAISLKEQLRQVNEGVHYHAPFLNVLKKGKEDTETRAKATQMFYDFYAMELMHRMLGSPRPDPMKGKVAPGELTPLQQAKLKAAVQSGNKDAMGAMFVGDWGDVEDVPQGISIVPAPLRKVIDQVYEEVVIQLTRKMMAHLRLTLVSEFRYIVTHASDWRSFRQKLVAIYNKGGNNITKEEFEAAIAEKIPGMKNHVDSVKRLLKFCKHYDAMSPDPADALPADTEPPTVGKPVEPVPQSEPEPELPPEPDPSSPPMGTEPSEPDTTDYDMPQVDIPPGADWGDGPYDYSSELEKEKTKQWLKSKKKKLEEGIKDPSYAAGRISPHTVLAVKTAINKSGLTWNDILLAYQNLNWGGSYGGPKWGEGVASFIKLMPQAKEENVEDMAGLIDHIYDLEHNTGELLNKGGMYVAPNDLDRRAKVTSLARYVPNVSPLVQRLILRVLQYTSKHPEIEKDIRKVTQSPVQEFTPEEQAVLVKCKFQPSEAGPEWTTQSPYVNKKEQTVQNQYTAKHHTNGMFSVEDTLDADIQVFETWPELADWIERNQNNFVKPQQGMSHYQPIKKLSPKDQYLSEKVKIKLNAEKETKLLEECKMAWRPSNHYYKAYLPGSDRFQFFAFSDGTFMGCTKNSKALGPILNDWHTAFQYCKNQTANALPNEDYDEGKAWIGKKIDDPAPHVTPSQTIPTPPSVGSVPSTEFTLSPIEINTFQILVSQHGTGIKIVPNQMPEGFTAFQIKIMAGTPMDFNVLVVGKKAIAPTGKKYVVKHSVFGGKTEEWSFANGNQVISFISTNFYALTQASTEVKDSVTAAVTPQIFAQPSQTPLPPPSNSKALYKAHLGLNKPPAHTIRLTQEDEDTLKGLGFEPQMVGTDVWYIHKTIGDTVKFFPNDVAKILFIKTNNKIIVTKKIDEAIEWLKNTYTGATKSPIVTPQTSTKGSKAGAMYEKYLVEKGFSWDDNSGKYLNVGNGDSIRISPFPKSTFYDGNTGEQKTFGSLPALANFLKGYDSLKKKY